MKKGEINFLGSELHTCIKNLDVKTIDGLEKVRRHLTQANKALEEQPKSRFWKDVVLFLNNKIYLGRIQ